ncbi:DUF2199 domain-containing protein [Streptomyces microflavus]|uniref:DUF2199 domain-containing protein n=1 Tax=Streptomyces microflavus TaxID=1919 RepID=A0A7J0D5U7_STRMI|nr:MULTISPECIES: DUF2199 domain-containing protein [Streptomyces]MDX2978318.1 DUF2199 domain-containing protein [Streptomyces sp. NRRL_B-2249]WSA58704.1 DUF2199 domain-containing protein [Streptomyces microflavus]WSS38724.1 DUF2199 domain-containing protein [Streptomyces microflavus]WST12558.1 DUF2199 domain-containing protein [Streptomyces microflavus]GFN09365.1 hypothetical protein Smic_79210 [Streptomyces microflavus]
MSYSTISPDVWDPSFESDPNSMLSSDQCVIKGQHFFIRGLIEIPVIGGEDVFSWGVWVSLSKENFAGALDVWNTEGREAEKPYFGWLSTELALYSESTTDLKTNAHTRPVGKRPFIELEPTDHPLAVEQRAGITQDRIREIAIAVLHPS